MTNLPQIFNFGDKSLNAFLDENGEPWFYASDVCLSLGLANISRAMSRLDEDEKGITLSDTLGGAQNVSIINESGLYSLTLSSKKKEAKEFKRWVTHDVIPQIRKTGSYAVREMSREQIVIQAFLYIKEDNERLLLENSEMKQQREENRPKLENYEELMDDRGLYTMTQCGNAIGISGKRLLAMLRDDGIFTKENAPKQEYLNKRFFEVVMTKYHPNLPPYPQSYATGLGMDLICSYFKTRNMPKFNTKLLK